MSVRRVLARGRGVIIMLALATLLVGCAPPTLPSLPWQAHGPTPLPDAQQVLHVSVPGVTGNQQTFDPIDEVGTDLVGPLIIPLLYSGLFTLDGRLRPVPALASGYNVSADGLRYTFQLRAGARFSDGAPITSADVAFSLDRAAGPCNSFASFNFTSLKDATPYGQENCAVNPHAPPTISTRQSGQPTIATLIGDALLTPDPSTLVIVLAHPDVTLLDKLAEPYSGIVEQSVVMRYGGDWTQHIADHGGQGTSGMYTTSEPVSDGANGQRVTLLRAKTYWGAVPRLREVVIDMRGPDQLTTGDVIINGTGAFNAQTASAKQTWYTAPARLAYYLTIDPTSAGPSDIRLRQALALALDKTALAAAIGGLATNHIVPPGTGDYPSHLSGPIATAPLSGDVAQAQALWASYVDDRCGGDATRCLAITIYVNDWLGRANVGPLTVSARWTSVLPGLRVNTSYPPDTLIWFPQGSIAPFSWYEDYPDPQDWLTPFVTQANATRPPLVHDPTADALATQAEMTRDPTTRLALYQRAENTLLNDAIVIPIAQAQVAWSITSSVANFPATIAPWIAPSAWARIYLT